MSPDEQALLERPISDLNLSVRARKCMVRLGISTIGELLRKTGDDLLECKNFGVTSLNEVREKLTQHGLKLRGD
jgi:DNA-directed RNA polymerase subunit alpha